MSAIIAALYRSPATPPAGIACSRRACSAADSRIVSAATFSSQVGGPLGARNGHDVLAPSQHPGQCNLRRSRTALRGEPVDHGGGTLIGIEVLALQARVAAPVVVGRVVLGALGASGQKSPAERTERNQSDAELPQRRQDSCDSRLRSQSKYRLSHHQCLFDAGNAEWRGEKRVIAIKFAGDEIDKPA